MPAPTLLIILGFVAVAIATGPFQGLEMSPSHLMAPLINSANDKEVEDAYRVMFKDAFGHVLESTNKPHTILVELATLSPASVLCGLREDSRAYLKGVIKNQYIKFKFALEDQAAVRRQFTFLATHYNARVLQKTLEDPAFLGQEDSDDNPARIDQDLIQEALDEFVSEHEILINANEKNQLYQIAVEAFQKKRQEGLALLPKLLEFRNDPIGTVTFIAYTLLNIAQADKNERTDSLNVFMAKRVMNFVRVAAALTPQEDAYKHFSQLSESLIVTGYSKSRLNIVFSAEIVRKILKTCAYATSLAAKRIGKEVLVSYFVGLKAYSDQPPSYMGFITRKHKRSGLKLQRAKLSTEYDRMLRIFAIDVLGTSLALPMELLEESDLKTLFLGFSDLAERYNVKEHQVFLRLRAMLLKAGAIMDKFPLLFESLYDAVLHATQYYTSGYKGIFTNPEDAPLLFDDYLDNMWGWKRKMISWLWQWEPDPKDFPINIEENYVFFKLIALSTWPEAFAIKDVSFQAFEYQNNYLIHKYTTEPAPRRVLNHLRLQFFPESAFNYRHLAGLKLRAAAMAALANYVASD